MKSVTIIFRIVFVSACCLFFSGSALTSAKEVETMTDSTDPVIKVEYGVTLETVSPMTSTGIKPSEAAAVVQSKKPASTTKKGLIYLPLISLSSYFPVAAQVFLMILVISLSGIFGAWLMFRVLAAKVLALETSSRPVPVTTAQPQPATFMHSGTVVPVSPDKKENRPLVLQPDRAGAKLKRRIVLTTNLVPVEAKKMSRKEKKKGQKKNNVSAKIGDSSGILMKVGDRLVLKRPGESQAATALRSKNASTGPRKNRIPQKFLINDWFPMDQQ